MFEAYRIGIRISLLAGGVTAGLVALSRQFNKLDGQVAGFQKRLSSIKMNALLGGMALGAGAGIFGFMHKAVNAAKEYTDELVYMRTQAGMTADQVKLLDNAAWNLTTKVPTISGTEALKALMDLRSIFGGDAEGLSMSIATAPAIAKAQALLAQMGVKNANEQAFSIAKTLEMMGNAVDPLAKNGLKGDPGRAVANFTDHLNLMLQGMQAFHAKILPKDFQNTITYLRSTRYGLGDEFLYKWLPTLMLEYKGGGSGGGRTGPGNALASLISNIVYGQLNPKTLLEWSRMGMIKKGYLQKTKGFGYHLLPGGVVGSEIFQRAPQEWMPMLFDAMKAHGVNMEDRNSIIRELTALAPSRTSNDIFVQLGLQAWKFLRDKKNVELARGLSGYQDAMAKSPELAEMAFQTQWRNIMVQLGYQIMPTLLDVLHALTPTLADLSAYLRSNPGAVKKFMLSLAALGTVLQMTGAFLIGLAGVQGFKLLIDVLKATKGEMPGAAKGLKAVAVAAHDANGALGVAKTAIVNLYKEAAIGAGAGGPIAALTGALSGLLAVAANVAAPLAAFGAVGYSLFKEHEYRDVLKDPKHAKAADLAKAIQYAHQNAQDYQNQIKRHQILPKTGEQFLKKWQSDEARLRAAQQPGVTPSAYVPNAGQGQAVIVKTALNVDGRQLAEATSRHLVRGLGYTNQVGRHDPNAGLPPAGLGYQTA